MYKLNKYIPPIRAPFNNPFLFTFKLPIELPINILIAVVTIMTGVIKFSLIFVYVKIIENTNNIIKVNIIDIITPFIIFIKFFEIFPYIAKFLLFYLYSYKKIIELQLFYYLFNFCNYIYNNFFSIKIFVIFFF